MSNPSLDLHRLSESVLRNPAYAEGLPRQNLAELSDDDRRAVRRNAMAHSAMSLSQQREKDHGPYDLDANLYQLMAATEPFFEAQHNIDDFRFRTKDVDWRTVPQEDKADYRQARQTLTDFNHIVREIIEIGGGKFNFNQLVTFMTNVHIANGGAKSANAFAQMAESCVSGMRVEVGDEQALIHSGIEFEVGTKDQDIHGGDFFIDGVGFDIKHSQNRVEKERAIARSRGDDPNVIIWSHIEDDYFNGQLILPADKNDIVARGLLADIKKVIGNEGMRRVS